MLVNNKIHKVTQIYQTYHPRTTITFTFFWFCNFKVRKRKNGPKWGWNFEWFVTPRLFISCKLQVCRQLALGFLKKLELFFQVFHPIVFEKNINEKNGFNEKKQTNRYDNHSIISFLIFWNMFELYVVACTCNSANLEVKFWNGMGSILVGG